MPRPAARRPLDRLRRICLALPDTWEKISHGEPTFWAGKRVFASFADADNHHGAGRHAVWCKSTHFEQEMLIARAPDRYFAPPYVGKAGWVGIYLDRAPDWTEITEVLRGAHALAKPPPSKRPSKR